MSDYILRFTDPANGAVVVKPFTSNGPDTPASEIPLDSSAASADTSLVLMGKGLPDYGDRIQENLLHLLEHCSYRSRPANPVQGQLWYKNADYVDGSNLTDPTLKGLYIYNGLTWDNLIVSGGAGGDLDLNGNKIVNLANPTDLTDGVNVQYADATYVALAGGTMTGPLSTTALTVTAGELDMSSFRIVQLSDPVADDDAVTKQYVDLAILNVTSGTGTFLPLTGGTLTGNLDLSEASLLVLDAGATYDHSPVTLAHSNLIMTGTSRVEFFGSRFNMNQHQVEQLSLIPNYSSSAASKKYVDDTVESAVYHDRDILVGDGVTTTLQLNTSYVVGSHDLCVYNNGVKQYMSQLAEVDVVFDETSAVTSGYQVINSPTSIYTDIALANAGTYVFSAVIDNITFYQQSVEVLAPTSFADLATALSTALSPNAEVHWNNTIQGLVIVSNSTGTSSNASFYYPDNTQPFDLFNTIMSDTGITMDFNLPVLGTAGTVNTETAVNIPVSSYAFDLNVDGTNYPITVNVTSPLMTIEDILSLLQTSISGSPANVSYRNNQFMFTTPTYGDVGIVAVQSDTFFDTVATGLATTAAIVYKGSRTSVSTVNTGTSEFSIVGDYTSIFNTSTVFMLSGSTGNDGVYTVASPSTFGAGETTITVVETIVDTTADGTIYFARDFAYEEVGTPASSSSSITFAVAPTEASVIEVIVSKKTPL